MLLACGAYVCICCALVWLRLRLRLTAPSLSPPGGWAGLRGFTCVCWKTPARTVGLSLESGGVGCALTALNNRHTLKIQPEFSVQQRAVRSWRSRMTLQTAVRVLLVFTLSAGPEVGAASHTASGEQAIAVARRETPTPSTSTLAQRATHCGLCEINTWESTPWCTVDPTDPEFTSKVYSSSDTEWYTCGKIGVELAVHLWASSPHRVYRELSRIYQAVRHSNGSSFTHPPPIAYP